MRGDELVTKVDLDVFKIDLLAKIAKLIAANGKPLKKWLKSVEVRKLLNVSPGKLQTMRKSGVLKFMRIGGSIYYEPSDIEQMFEQHKVSR